MGGEPVTLVAPDPPRPAAGAGVAVIDPISYHVPLRRGPDPDGASWDFTVDPGVAPPAGVYAAVLTTVDGRRLVVVRVLAPTGLLVEDLVHGVAEVVGTSERAARARAAVGPEWATITLFGWIRAPSGRHLDLGERESDALWARLLRADLVEP